MRSIPNQIHLNLLLFLSLSLSITIHFNWTPKKNKEELNIEEKRDRFVRP